VALLLLILLLVFALALHLEIFLLTLLIHDSEDGEEASSGDIDDVLVVFEQKTPIRDVLATFLVIFIEVGLLLELNASGRETGGIESRKAIFFLVLAFVMHDVIVVADGMDVDVCATLYTAHLRPFLHPHRVTLAQRALHPNYYNPSAFKCR
jgi:hypothetical protein